MMPWRFARAIITSYEYLSSPFFNIIFFLCPFEPRCLRPTHSTNWKKQKNDLMDTFILGTFTALALTSLTSPTVAQTLLYLFMRVCIQINWALVNRRPCLPNLRSKRWRGSGHSHRTPWISCVHRDKTHALYYAAQVKNNKMLHEIQGKLCVRRLRESTIDTQPQSRNNSQRKIHSMETNKY